MAAVIAIAVLRIGLWTAFDAAFGRDEGPASPGRPIGQPVDAGSVGQAIEPPDVCAMTLAPRTLVEVSMADMYPDDRFADAGAARLSVVNAVEAWREGLTGIADGIRAMPADAGAGHEATLQAADAEVAVAVDLLRAADTLPDSSFADLDRGLAVFQPGFDRAWGRSVLPDLDERCAERDAALED